ncbi:3-oxoacyl-[acyl-carrier-protein] synthase 1 [Phocoenobacter uteri]|uniref:3-oxoacyl-[acyl-carrier-protein] synthase 1 n=1 Tax=Phocoenobacter uteri TaxID=146806 RepID=A0A379CBX0_9PAST|nr:beta-ketoacyl-ACP synthase I [Phocoenobacter uteri]MDG6881835.1 beta-ketoacyl-[acyl-carrier-protein] synthase I [Phocoenobacter uteri]SUB59872.1 3-oxoacyl-[acyl-carrier-protein] synthase 1 [Phocoenobacter uteri]
MKRVVITGLGVVSSIGNNKEEVLNSLKTGKSGIEFVPEFAEMRMRSQVAGTIKLDPKEFIDRKAFRFMGDCAGYAYISMKEAIEDAKLTEDQVSNERTGLVIGSGIGSGHWQLAACNAAQSPRGIKAVGPYAVTKTMSSSVSACLATPFKIKGVNYSISSACATSAHCIGNAMELIQLGKQDIVFAGGGEELAWESACEFDAMGAVSTKYNDTPEKASRAYDADRDGFVISGGAAVVVVEELEHALARGATIYAEIVGYGATSDGYDMVAPSGEGAIRCMKQALANVQDEVEYINVHGTSTPVGDVKELEAIKAVFSDKCPAISSTKSMTGHSLGAAGAHEAVYSLLMLKNDFIAPSINIDNLDEKAQGLNIVTECQNKELTTVMSNSFGFGGTNACLVFKKYNG